MNQPDPPTNLLSEQISDEQLPEIRRARFQRLTIYEVEESELLILERGTLGSIYINISIALLSLAIGLTATLTTATFPSERAWLLFLVVTVVGYVVGVSLLFIGWTGRRSIAACVREIRRRLPTDGLDQD